MIKILIEVLVQVFHDNVFFSFFSLFLFSFSFDLIFGLCYIYLMAISFLSTSERNLYVHVCVLRVKGSF